VIKTVIAASSQLPAKAARQDTGDRWKLSEPRGDDQKAGPEKCGQFCRNKKPEN
jgi:hypothetical protein